MDMTQIGTVLVASVSIVRDGKVLMIQESKPSARYKWNFPSGKLEPGERITDAALREVKEETGYEVTLTGTTGVYHFVSGMNSRVMMFHFAGEIAGGSLQLAAGEIIGSKWVELSEMELADDAELREASVLRRIAENMRSGNIYPLTLYQEQWDKRSGLEAHRYE